jgi:hypothetical protein
VDQSIVNPSTIITKDINESLPAQYSSILKSKTHLVESKQRVRDSIRSLSDLNISIENYEEQLVNLSTIDSAPHVAQHGYVIVRNSTTPYVRPVDEKLQHSPKKQSKSARTSMWRQSAILPMIPEIDKEKQRKLYWVTNTTALVREDEIDEDDTETLNDIERELYRMRGIEHKFKPMKQVTRVLDFGTEPKETEESINITDQNGEENNNNVL